MAPCAATAPMVSMEKSFVFDSRCTTLIHIASFQKDRPIVKQEGLTLMIQWYVSGSACWLSVVQGFGLEKQSFPMSPFGAKSRWILDRYVHRVMININKQKTNHAAIDTVIWQSIVQKYRRYDVNSRYTIQLTRQSIIFITCHRGWNPPGILPKETEKMTWENDLHKQSAIARYHDSQSCVDVCVMLSSWDFCLDRCNPEHRSWDFFKRCCNCLDSDTHTKKEPLGWTEQMQTARTIQSTSKDRISNLEDSNVNSNLENMFYASMWIGATKASQGTHSVLHLSNCWDVFSGQSTHIPYSSNASRSIDIWDFYPSPKPPSMDKTSTKIYNHLTTKLPGILTVESSKPCESHLSTQQKDIPQKWGGPFFLHTNHTKPMVLTTGSLSGIISKANALSREGWRCFLIGVGKRSLIGIDNE